MGLFAFNRARRLAQQAPQPDAPDGGTTNTTTTQQAQQPDAQKPKRASRESQTGKQDGDKEQANEREESPRPTGTRYPHMDALPPGGGSYTRQPDGTLVSNDVPNTPAPELPADTATQATPE